MVAQIDFLQALSEQFQPIFAASPDGVYLCVDGTYRMCSERLAAMFGYSDEEWQAVGDFLDVFVDEHDQALFGWNYQHRAAALAFPVTFRFRARRKDGSTFAAETDMIPLPYDGHVIAYHFVRRVGA